MFTKLFRSNRASMARLPAGLVGAVIIVSSLFFYKDIAAFCGFYVAKAGTGLFNQASKVVLVRDGDNTIVTMANDFRGDTKEFALVVPVPVVLERSQIHIGDAKVIDHLDSFTSPRLVEYYDANPCYIQRARLWEKNTMADAASGGSPAAKRKAKQYGVTIEANYTVGEYDILILSARQSGGLFTWLNSEGYMLPTKARPVLKSYIKQGLKFFVAKVNLKAQKKLGYAMLRPIQIAYSSPRFMLPVRLGTVNSTGSQDLFLFVLTKSGRAEVTNYRTIPIPTGQEVPVYIKNEFSDFYRAMFANQVQREGMDKVYLEYAWDMSWCDPCAADPLSAADLKKLGVWWTGTGSERGGAQNVYVTRLHARYNAGSFPDDLRLTVTPNRQNFQGRYVMRHAWPGPDTCPAATAYRRDLSRRVDAQVQNLAWLTGWDPAIIRQRTGAGTTPVKGGSDFWKSIWGND